MANENIGVFRKLNNHSIPWQEKIKVAQHAWDSDQCIIPNKQQVLLDWVSQQLVDIYKKKKSKDTTKGLWDYLVHILSNFDSKTSHKKTLFALMPQLLQVFTEVFTSTDFETSDVSLKVLQCGQIILSNPELNLTLLAKFENYLLYLSSLLKTFSTLNGDKITNKTIHKEAFLLLEVSLNLYIPLQRRQTNHKKLFEKAYQHLLVPIVYVWNCLMGSEQALLETEGRIHGFVNLLHQALSDALFRKEHLSEYASSMKALSIQQSSNDADYQEPKPKKAKIGNYTKELFETLRNQCSQGKDDNAKNILNFLPQLFIEFLKARRCNNLSSSSLEFEFFMEMCSLLGVKFKEEEDPPLLSCSVIGLVYTLLNTLLSYDVYQVAEDNSNGKIQFKWFTGFITILLKIQPSNEVFECLQVLLQLNHYIVEPYLTTVLQISWRNDSQERKDASASDLLLSALVKTYTKLRQFDRFVGHMLKSLPGAVDITTKWTGLPKQFQDEMVKACQILPYGLATNLWKLFNQEIINTYLPTLQTLSQSKGKANNQEKEKIFCFERVVGLYQTFLVNTALGRVAEQHKTEAIVTNLTNLCQDMHDKVTGPALEILPLIEDNKLHKSISTSVLVLYHTLQEMNTYLGKFGLISHDEHCKIATDQWNKYLLTHFNHKQKRKGKERLIFIKVLIAIQRLRIYMRGVALPVGEKEIQKLVDFLFHWLEDSVHSTANSCWNLQLWSINTATFDAAYWFTLCSFAPVLLTISTDKQRQQFAYYLIKTLLLQNVDSIGNHERNKALT